MKRRKLKREGKGSKIKEQRFNGKNETNQNRLKRKK